MVIFIFCLKYFYLVFFSFLKKMMKINIESLIKLDERNDKFSVVIGIDLVIKKRYSKDSLFLLVNFGYFLFKIL